MCVRWNRTGALGCVFILCLISSNRGEARFALHCLRALTPPVPEPAVLWPPGRWQTLEELEKGLKLTPTPSVGAQVPDGREQGDREGWGYLFQQHRAVRPQQAPSVLVSQGTFVLTVARWP